MKGFWHRLGVAGKQCVAYPLTLLAIIAIGICNRWWDVPSCARKK